MIEELSVPNLDAATDIQELRQVAAAFNRLADYSTLTATAREHRAAGRVAVALAYEHAAERVFNQLPLWARW
jgi:hypothetical protein